jgi:hypothetical protein
MNSNVVLAVPSQSPRLRPEISHLLATSADNTQEPGWLAVKKHRGAAHQNVHSALTWPLHTPPVSRCTPP